MQASPAGATRPKDAQLYLRPGYQGKAKDGQRLRCSHTLQVAARFLNIAKRTVPATVGQPPP